MPRKAKRRAPGEGTIYYRESDERWVAELTLEDGKRKYLYAKKQEEVVLKLKQAQYELKQGILATGPKQKLGEYLNYWLNQVHKRKIRASTYVRYRQGLNMHILPALGQIQLQKLTMRQIQQFYNGKLEENLSSSTIHNMHKVLHGALEHAVKERLISINPAKGVSIPQGEKRKIRPLTSEQAQLLLTTTQGSTFEPIMVMALTAAMRQGEILSLHWEDINFEAGTIYVHRSLTETEERKYIEGDPKTEASERNILLPLFSLTILKMHRTRQNEMRLKAGSAWLHYDLVCCTSRGNYLHPGNVRKQFHRLLKKAGLPSMPFHDLRHGSASLLISLGVNPKVVQEILGHSSLAMTNVYSHVLPSMQKEAAEKMNTLFQKPN